MFSLIGFAQSKVSGIVKDAGNGQPLPGVTVAIKGTTTAVSTDINGAFSINVPATGTIRFSMIGYAPKEIAINGSKSIEISLSPSSSALNEVVVVGYGVQRRSRRL